jgi:myo-inositol-1(or 4)-monophosphatase
MAYHDSARLLCAASQAVDMAADAVRHGRFHVGALVAKGGTDFATPIDFEVERLVRVHLHGATPTVPFLGEEEGGVDLTADAVWVLDPIDGTANYTDGSPLCSISLALVRRGEPVLAIVDAPLLGERFVAISGAGAFRNGAPISIAARELGDPLVALSDFAFGRKHADTNPLRLAVIAELVRRRMRLRIHGSVALDLAWLACGRMSAAIALSNVPWDVSAGVLLVREAGGLVFDADGARHGPDSRFTLASVPARQEQVLEIIAQAREPVGAP